MVSSLAEQCQRIIKSVPKNEEGYESLQSEVSILKQINLSAVPKIYEVLETEDSFCLVEEYMEGKTLREVVDTEGILDINHTLLYGRQLTEIILQLHSVKPDAVLHLDIQPKNIMIHNGQLSLIDFGNAIYKNTSEDRVFVKGTPGFAAPEQYHAEKADERTDIYGIGACMAFMNTGDSTRGALRNTQGYFRDILAGCLAEKKENRFSSCEVLMEKLSFVKECISIEKKKKGGSDSRNTISKPVIFSFAGTQQRIGTSVLALRFTKYLHSRGIMVLYEENNGSGMVAQIVKKDHNARYENGIFYVDEMALRPYYDNPNIRFDGRWQVIVRDEGVFECKRTYEGILILVAGIRCWEAELAKEVYRTVERKKILGEVEMVQWLWNLSGGRGEEIYLESVGTFGICVPYMEEKTEKEMDVVCKKLAEKFIFINFWEEKKG